MTNTEIRTHWITAFRTGDWIDKAMIGYMFLMPIFMLGVVVTR